MLVCLDHDFNEYCMNIEIYIEYPAEYVHTQNRLAKSIIKDLKSIAVPLLIRSKLSMSS